MKRKKMGFSIEICENRYDVFFKNIKDWKIICTIQHEKTHIYKGIAKCNKEFDTFNESDGKVIAFDRAFEKLQKHLLSVQIKIQSMISKEHSMQLKQLDYKFNKMIKKGEI
jgi:hypothetical protein